MNSAMYIMMTYNKKSYIVTLFCAECLLDLFMRQKKNSNKNIFVHLLYFYRQIWKLGKSVLSYLLIVSSIIRKMS